MSFPSSPFSPAPSYGGPPGGPGQSLLPPGPPGGPIIDADYRMLVQDAEQSVGPQPPPWYVPGSKPDPEEIQAEAVQLQAAHGSRVRAQAWMELRLGMERSAIFNNDKLWVDMEEIEPQSSPVLRRIYDAIVNFIADQTVSFESLARGYVNREERARIENHLTDAIRDVKDTTFIEGQGDFLRVVCADAMAGMVALFTKPDPSNLRSGQRTYRVDPKVVYPVMGRNGPERVYTIYWVSYPEIMRDFSDGPGGPATKAIQKIARKGGGRGKRSFDMETQYKLIGYWDREYELIMWNGQVIKQNRHALWECPWLIGIPNWRNNAGSKAQNPYSITGRRGDPYSLVETEDGPLVSYGAGSPQEMEITRTYEPFLSPWVTTADKIEKALTRAGYGVDRALSSSLVWIRGMGNVDEGAPEVNNYRNGVTEVGPEEKLDMLPINPLSDSFGPFMELLQQEIQMNIPVPILQGQSIGTQASGNALDVINEMGLSMYSPVVSFMQSLLGNWAHRILNDKKNWSGAYDPEEGEGFAVQPGYNGGGDRLTAEMLERAGCYVDCTLSRFTLNGMAAAATTAAILNTQLGIGTRVHWIRKFGMSPNAQEMEDSRRDQDMEDAPGYVEANQIIRLYDQLWQAAESGDTESQRRIDGLVKRMVSKQTMYDMQMAQQVGLGQNPALPPGQDPQLAALMAQGQGGGQQQPPGMAPNAAPMLNTGEVGTEGGAPMQAPPPGVV